MTDEPNEARAVEVLREALAARDAKVAPCPYMRTGRPEFSQSACNLCGADSSEPCLKRTIADGEFVDAARQVLATPLTDAAIVEAVRIEREALDRVADWLASVAECDPTEIVADGGITAGMVIVQEAREQLRRLRSTASARGETA